MEDRLAAIADDMRQSRLSRIGTARDAVRVHISTMGCAKNEVDSAHMAQLLCDAGYTLVSDASAADCIIVNTCSFIQPATEESIEVVFAMCGLDTVASGDAKVVVAGCMPARYGDDLAQSLTEVETFVPCSSEDDIVAIVDALFPEASASALPDAGQGDSLAFGGASVYVKISEGCDRFCSFCTIPFIRGRYHSYPVEQVVGEVARAVAQGAREVVLIAQDTGRYGIDLPVPTTLANLLATLAQQHPRTWFRVMYVQPEGVTDELLDVMATHDNVCSYLDIPFQHANAGILANMNRAGSGAEYLALIDKVRKRVPDVALRTTLIVGFSGEGEAEFDELCSFVEEADLDYVGVFAYSPEEGTRAETMPEQVPEEERQYRSATIRDVADAISSVRIAGRVGQTMDVLVLGREDDGQLFGRAMCQAPDVDGVVYLSAGEVGSVVSVTIDDTLLYEMEGTLTCRDK